ncbi:hypothetical protein [Streptomyces sp. NPDC014806]|uniref:hypothetical protein n=1 Tax=Streptomyces sp. NPDC014806 TaxID=3364920 RepID=UPI0036F6F66D
MSESAAPLPPQALPEGIRLWSSDEAAAWVRAGCARWARPWWSAAALAVSVVWAVAVTPDRPCTEAAPCGADWPGLGEVGLALGLLLWVFQLPELTVVAAPVLAVLVGSLELPGADPAAMAANGSVLPALCFGWAGAVERLAARHRQRKAAECVTPARGGCPGPDAPVRRGSVPLALGLLLLAVTATAVVQALDGVRADERHAVRAERLTAQVVGHGTESVRLRTDDGRRLTVASSLPEDYARGGAVTVLEDGSWRRLAAEPYDAFGWQLLMLAAGLPGVSLFVAGLLARRRAVALRDAPVPVLRVLTRVDEYGGTWIYAGDDTSGRAPVLRARFEPVEAADGPQSWKVSRQAEN